MPSPSTSTLRSGRKLASRFSGGGALEKSCMRLGCCGCCWKGAKKSPPNQPPPPPPERCGAGRDQPPKLKSCADAGPAMPTRGAMATVSTASGPLSVNTRKNDFGFRIRLGRNEFPLAVIIAERGRKRADIPHKRAAGSARQVESQIIVFKGYFSL